MLNSTAADWIGPIRKALTFWEPAIQKHTNGSEENWSNDRAVIDLRIGLAALPIFATIVTALWSSVFRYRSPITLIGKAICVANAVSLSSIACSLLRRVEEWRIRRALDAWACKSFLDQEDNSAAKLHLVGSPKAVAQLLDDPGIPMDKVQELFTLTTSYQGRAPRTNDEFRIVEEEGRIGVLKLLLETLIEKNEFTAEQFTTICQSLSLLGVPGRSRNAWVQDLFERPRELKLSEDQWKTCLRIDWADDETYRLFGSYGMDIERHGKAALIAEIGTQDAQNPIPELPTIARLLRHGAGLPEENEFLNRSGDKTKIEKMLAQAAKQQQRIYTAPSYFLPKTRIWNLLAPAVEEGPKYRSQLITRVALGALALFYVTFAYSLFVHSVVPMVGGAVAWGAYALYERNRTEQAFRDQAWGDFNRNLFPSKEVMEWMLNDPATLEKLNEEQWNKIGEEGLSLREMQASVQK